MILRLTNICYAYNSSSRNALEKISFQVDSSEPLGILGKNGSGKTTLLKILVQQNINYVGDYSIDNVNSKGFNGEILSKCRWGYLPEEIELDGRLTGYETATVIAGIRGLDEGEFKKEILDLRNRLRIANWFETKMCREYSAGMRRKVGLLIAFMGHRQLVILDEPTTFLDVLTVLELKKLIREKIAEGVGIIISSHIVDFIASLLDRIVVLNDGQLQYDGKLSVLRQEVPDKTLDNIFIDLLSDKASEGMGNT